MAHRPATIRITALLASHNRRDRTLACLRSYFDQEIASEVSLAAVLVDDASIDGTTQAVRDSFTRVQVVTGTGDLFWAGGMARAEEIAMASAPDYLLWLNDDVVLDDDALKRLQATTEAGDGAIAVGALRDPATGELTYSGVSRLGRHPMRMRHVEPSDVPTEVDTFNGNVVLVPRTAAKKVGPLDGALGHAAADFDYGLRAQRVGVASFLAPGTVGICELNRESAPWCDDGISLSDRLRLLLGPKGFPPRPRARYLSRHGGLAWPLYWLAPYIRRAPEIVRGSTAKTPSR